MNLYERLMWTAKENRYPMHMPGHKRAGLFTMANPYAFDVTEIDGTDNLHQPEGEILWEMEQMKQKYGTKDSYLLVNGSTCGILAAISACCHPGDCQKLPPFGVPCRGTFVVEAGLCISGSR